MAARDIILRPVVTEQSMDQMDDKKYTFDVVPTANKVAVRHAVEEIFGVQVKKVNIANVKPKQDKEAAQSSSDFD
jgi:large subunit ribosomal protein L23